MAKNFSKTQKKRRSVKKQTKKNLSLNSSSKVKVRKKSNVVATVKKKNTKASTTGVTVSKNDLKKKQSSGKTIKTIDKLDLPKLKNDNKEVKFDVIETVKKDDLKAKLKDQEVIKEEVVEEEKVLKEKEPEKEIEEVKEVEQETPVEKEEVHEEPKEEVIEEVKDKKEEKNEIVEASYDNKESSREEKKRKEEEKRKLVENTQVLYNIFVSDYMKQNKKLGKRKVKKIYDYEQEDNDEVKEVKREKSKHFIVNVFYFIKDNLFLLFNTVLGLTFIFLLIGMIETHAFSRNFIIYVSCLLVFLILIAMSYNKYFSGRLLTILLCCGMGFAIYKLQYNYDFLDSLDHRNYETKTYYVVTFDNNLTKKVYSLTNKKVGILKDNQTNIKRKFNIKVDNVNYVECSDLETMANAFYGSEMRAVIVTPNQYRYLSSSENRYNRKIKILYTFEAVGLK